ncbi:MAG: DUF2779 domain-containing protein [Thermoanaerobaculaceae bacterium]|nr:DUF2779 domain-containing protein [Thermoanaerobaculaceae bacterium]
MASRYRLSKTRFTAGLQCHKQLWWKVHEPDAPELVPTPAQQAVFDQGTRVGEVARTYVPGGALVDAPHNAFARRLATTKRLLEQRVPAVYEASFDSGGVYAAVDILERDGDRFRLIEVKSSTRIKDEHIPDVAVQLHVLRAAGLDVEGAELMHLNRECTFPDLEDLFVREDVTGAAEAWQPELPELIAGQLRMLAGGLPDVPIGEHCTKPYECPFMSRCWAGVPEHHVSTLYRAPHGGAALIAAGFETIAELPADGLNAIQARQREAVLTGRIVVEPGLDRALRVFDSPLAFLDFETVAPAIPVWDGCHPYEQVPVQFSCDVEAAGETLVHHEWLADGPGDPRPELARALVAACAGARTVVAYNAGFERGCIERLADAVPELADDLLAIAGRLADPLPIVRAHVYHPDFHGSFSLKSVLPALVPAVIAGRPTPSGHCEERSDDAIPSDPTVIARSPADGRDDEAIPSPTGCPPSLPGPRDCFVPPAAGLAMTEEGTIAATSPSSAQPVIARSPADGRDDEAISWSPPTPPNPPSTATTQSRPQSPYDGLEIAEGATAAVELVRLLFHGETMTAAERAHLRDALLRYCAVDTMSMVRLLERLRELA